MKREIRLFKPGVDATTRKISGTPIVFNSRSEPLGGAKKFREVVSPGAVVFTDDLRADFAHDSRYILGCRSKGTLTIREDAAGIHMEAMPPDTQWARDLAVSIERGDIEGGSFQFRVLPDGETWTRDGEENIRTLTKILVDRVTVTSEPAYPETDMQIRSAAEVAAEIPQGQSAGQAAPPAKRGGVVNSLRRIQIAERE